MKRFILLSFLIALLFVIIFVYSGPKEEEEVSLAPLSENTQECIECHGSSTPGIVEDWMTSEHARGTPAASMEEPPLKREVSSKEVPENLLHVAVGCFECHSLNPEQHRDSFEHFGFNINVVVSPNDCGTCHEEERGQYSKSKKANALKNLLKNPLYQTLLESITSSKVVKEGRISHLASTDYTKAETCYACHGTKIELKGEKIIDTDLGEVSVPELSGWPNQGVGRDNPDGSKGACTSCHPRHSFSLEIARKPDTCSQCHLEPDIPAWNVYRESKHGNIYYSKGSTWNWEHIPWVVGKDFKAPTCAACHNSLLTNQEGEIVAERSHDFGARLWVRIFGLIYSHPQPKSGQTHIIKQKDGLPLPVDFKGVLASEYLLDEAQQQERQDKMKKVCQSCHASSWAENHFARFHSTLEEADKMVRAATELIMEAWNSKCADPSNPFDEAVEHSWIEQWLFFANSVRYASAMIGPDYAAFKNGWWKLTKNLQEMNKYITRNRMIKK
ncbi:MAG: multiheme c-type cytochrome [Candidatus Aminicenantaceae bacterium]